MKNIAIIGARGALGAAFVEFFASRYPDARVHALSRTPKNITQDVSYASHMNISIRFLEYTNEESLAQAAAESACDMPLDMVIIATGVLCTDDIMPEKSLNDLSVDKMLTIFTANTIVPALCAKHFIPFLHRKKRVVFAALSARVGSISDNQLGGWYAYRSSKAALNMIIKTAAIEIARRSSEAVIVGLHPGTVDSSLSRPFQAHIAREKIFTPSFAVQQMVSILDTLTAQDSGKCFAWDGKEIAP